jgi:Holliday junction resolvase RusA-like endonuclease
MTKFKNPKCPNCGCVQKASSALEWTKGNYACRCNSVDYFTYTRLSKIYPLKEEDTLSLGQDEEIKLVITGNPSIKKNSQRIILSGIRPSVLFEVWAARAIKQLLEQFSKLNRKPISGPVELECHYYRDTHRHADLSNLHEGIQDCLTYARVWIDDSIVESHDGSRKHYDKKNPRVELTIRKFKG